MNSDLYSLSTFLLTSVFSVSFTNSQWQHPWTSSLHLPLTPVILLFWFCSGITIVFLNYKSQWLTLLLKSLLYWGAWVAQSVQRLTLAQVMISQPMGWSLSSGSVLTAQSPEPASDSVCLSLSAPPLLALCLSFSLKISKH